jgi:hypothetical protein
MATLRLFSYRSLLLQWEAQNLARNSSASFRQGKSTTLRSEFSLEVVVFEGHAS